MSLTEKRIRALFFVLGTVLLVLMIFAVLFISQTICGADGTCIVYDTQLDASGMLWHPALFLAPIALGMLGACLMWTSNPNNLALHITVAFFLWGIGMFLGAHGIDSIFNTGPEETGLSFGRSTFFLGISAGVPLILLFWAGGYLKLSAAKR